MIFLPNMGKKEKLGLAMAMVIVFIAGFDRLIIAPIGQKFKKLNSEIRMNERQLAQGLRNLSRKEDIVKEYQKYLPYIKSKYSEGEEVAKLFEEIEGISRNAGISIADMKPRPHRQIDAYRYYYIEIEVEGSMETLINFLHQLGGSQQLYRVNKIYISAKASSSSAIKASILLTKVVVS